MRLDGVCVFGFSLPSKLPGNFHLQGQMKVTKAKALNATPVLAFCTLRHRAQRATWPLRCDAWLQRTRRGLAARRPGVQRAWAGSGSLDQRGRGFAKPAPPSVMLPRCAADYPSGPLGAGPAREERTERCCIEPLCFGDFHLGPQMKVTRPPGRDPAGNADRSRAKKQDKSNARNGPQAALCTPARVTLRGPCEVRWSN